MARLKGLTIEQHEQLGRDLKLLLAEAHRIANIIGPAYGARYCDMAIKIRKPVGILRCKLEDKMFAEYPHSETSVYYGE